MAEVDIEDPEGGKEALFWGGPALFHSSLCCSAIAAATGSSKTAKGLSLQQRAQWPSAQKTGSGGSRTVEAPQTHDPHCHGMSEDAADQERRQWVHVAVAQRPQLPHVNKQTEGSSGLASSRSRTQRTGSQRALRSATAAATGSSKGQEGLWLQQQ